MNKGIVKLISSLAVIAILSGCTSMSPTADSSDTDRPILSAAEAEAQIRVTVRPVAPAAAQETIVAAID